MYIKITRFLLLLVCVWVILTSCLHAQTRKTTTVVLDNFSTTKAWSTMRDGSRMKAEYASWEMGTDPDGYLGKCMKLSFSLIAASADIWGTYTIDEPIESVGMWIKNTSKVPATLSLTLNENDGSMYVGKSVELSPDSKWHYYSFPFKTFNVAPWSNDENGQFDYPVTKIIPALSQIQPNTPVTIFFDELSVTKPMPKFIKLRTKKLPVSAKPGDTISVSGSITPDENIKSPKFEVQLVHNNAVISRSTAATKDWKAGKTTAFGPIKLKIPKRSWHGQSKIVFRMNGVKIKDRKDGIIGSVQILKGKNPMNTYSVKKLYGTPQLYENSKPISATGFMYEFSNPDQVKKFAKAGVHLYVLECRHMGWVGPDEYDFKLIDELMAELFECDPEARVVPFYYIDMAPPLVGSENDWWQDLHRDQLCVDENGNVFKRYGHETVSFASELWRKDCAKAMQQFIAHMENSPYSDRIVGYQPSAGGSYEWMYHGGQDSAFLDYSEPTVKAFQNWLKKKYKNDVSLLRQAWKNTEVSFDTAYIPLKALREQSSLGAIRDPEREMPVIDYYIFLSELTVDTIDYFCKIVKDTTKNTKLAGVFYGYILEQMYGGYCTQHTGHFALGKILNSKNVDFLMSPTSYWERQPGGTGGHMTAMASLRLHNKLWINQADIRTHLSAKDSGYGRCDNEEQAVSVIRREFAMDLTAGIPVYWYSFSNPWFGGSDVLMKEIKTMAKIDAAANKTDRSLNGNKLAVIVSDSPAAYTALPSEPIRSLAYLQREFLIRSGIQFDVYLDTDLLNPNMPKYKAYLFLDSIHMSNELRKQIAALKKDGIVMAWVWGQGIVNNDLSLANAEELCGIKLKLDTTSGINTIVPIDGYGPEYGSAAEYSPAIYPDDPTAQTLGTIKSPDALANKPGLVVKKYADWTTVYSSAPRLSSEIIRKIAELAGIHIYSTGNDPIYINNQYIGLHSKEAGKRQVNLPVIADVIDCFTGKFIARKTNNFTIDMKAYETGIYRIEY